MEATSLSFENLSMDDLESQIKMLEGKRYTDSNIDELQECYRELTKRLQGKKVKVVAVRGDDHQIRMGEIYDFVGIEAGIFQTTYTTIQLREGKTLTGHSYRFELLS